MCPSCILRYLLEGEWVGTYIKIECSWLYGGKVLIEKNIFVHG